MVDKTKDSVLERAQRIAERSAAAAFQSKVGVNTFARQCVDLALALQAAMSRPIHYPPDAKDGRVIGELQIQDDGRFMGRMPGARAEHGDWVSGPYDAPEKAIGQIVLEHERRVREAQGVR